MVVKKTSIVGSLVQEESLRSSQCRKGPEIPILWATTDSASDKINDEMLKDMKYKLETLISINTHTVK